MINSYVKLGIAALLPVIASAILYKINKKTNFGKKDRVIRGYIHGLIFGILAIIGTEWGIPMNGAMVNCRDAAVLAAGLIFGPRAGIVAGMIGAIERWVAVSWGVGTFTRTACSLSTLIAGFYSAALRVYMFEDKRPNWPLAFAVGIVMEIFHLTMVFITNMASPDAAMAVVKACTIPMVTANGISVMLSTMLVDLFAKEEDGYNSGEKSISRTIQRWMFATVVMAFALTSFFVYQLQDTMAKKQADSLLQLAGEEVSADIIDASDANMISLSYLVYREMANSDLDTIAAKYNIAEIDVIDKNGIIVECTEPSFVGFDMASGEQSAEFLCLLDDSITYVQKYGPISYDKSVYRKYAGLKTGDGFIQVGYNAEQFQQDIDEEVMGITRNRHVGSSGYILVFNGSHRIVSCPKELDQSKLQREIWGMKLPMENQTFEAVIDGVACYCRYIVSEGYYILSVLPKTEAFQLRNVALCVNTFMEILVFALLFALIFMLIRRVVVTQIKDINTSLSKITAGDLDEVVDVRSNDEFDMLSDGINSTVTALKGYIDEATARIKKDLQLAKDIQESALPNIFPAFPKRHDFDIFASMNPAKEVGGDFYDFYITNQDMLHVLIADVSGKGIPAAMFMMRAKTELKTLTEADIPLNEVFTHGNAALCEGNDAGMFVTAWQCQVDLTNGNVRFVNAGHNPPLVKHGDGSFEYLRSRVGFVLAGMDGVVYRAQEMKLEPGDTLFLYTDGVTEATDANTELFGEDRLLNAINSKEFASMQELCTFVKSQVDEFVGEAPQFDDIIMVALKYLGN